MQRSGGKIDDSLKDWGGFEFLVLFVWICFLVKEKVRGLVFWGPKESIVKLLRSCMYTSEKSKKSAHSSFDQPSFVQ